MCVHKKNNMDTDSVESEDMALEESSNDESNQLDAEIDQLGVSRKFRDRRRNSSPYKTKNCDGGRRRNSWSWGQDLRRRPPSQFLAPGVGFLFL